jgi:hypothetical protein
MKKIGEIYYFTLISLAKKKIFLIFSKFSLFTDESKINNYKIVVFVFFLIDLD